jgi:glycosyltransferase involved in cell wall biosynthesis
VRIALDATYSVDPHPSGIAIYSRELLESLLHLYPQEEWLACYRAKQFKQVIGAPMNGAGRRLLLPPLPTFRADVFHALNQRVDHRPTGKVVSTFHDLFVMTGEYSSPEFRARFAQQARHAAGNSDLIIAVSEFTAGQVNELLDFSRTRIRVIPHGVRAPLSAASCDQRENMILCVGALQTRKNIVRLVGAFEQLESKWQLTIAGATTGYGAQEIMARIATSPAAGRIRVTGYMTAKALADLYSRASVFAFPSLDEGFGIPVLEAMAYGVPVLTSNRSALPEVAGDCALLVDPESSEEIYDALRRLTADCELRRDLAERGRERARNFPWERSAHATYQVYKELLGA